MKGIMKYHEKCYGIYTLPSVILLMTNGPTHTFVVTLVQVSEGPVSGQEQHEPACDTDLEAIFAFSLAWCFDLFLTDNEVPGTGTLLLILLSWEF